VHERLLAYVQYWDDRFLPPVDRSMLPRQDAAISLWCEVGSASRVATATTHRALTAEGWPVDRTEREAMPLARVFNGEHHDQPSAQRSGTDMVSTLRLVELGRLRPAAGR
jgi:hypothetical protein